MNTKKMDIKKIALFLVLIVGCKAAKEVQKPVLPIGTEFRNAALKTDTVSIADVQWKNFYTDVTLQELIDTALIRNYDMQIALKQLESAQLLFRQVKWNYIPELALHVTASSNRPSDNSLTARNTSQLRGGSSHVEDYMASLQLSWEADIWGKIRNKNSVALAGFLQTDEARKLIRTDLVARISQGYYNLLMLDTQLDIAQKNVRLNDSTLRIVRLQYEAGQVTSLAVQQIEAQRQAAAQLLPQFEQNIVLQENALSILTGQLPSAVERRNKLSQLSIADDYSTGVPSAMVGRRPDVRSAELALTISDANVGIARANLYPSLRITAGGGLNAFRATDWFNVPASLFGIVAGGITQPILNGRRLRTQYEIARIEREQTVLVFRKSVLNAMGEVSDALNNMEKLKHQHRIATDRVTTLKKATTNAGLLFKNGLANYLEVITAQGNVLQGELELASLKRAELNAVSDLYRSLGGGWK